MRAAPAVHGVRPFRPKGGQNEKAGQTDVVRWRLLDLCQWLRDEFGVSIAKPTLSREVRAMGYRKLSARPRHYAQAVGAIDLFKTASLPCWTRLRARRASVSPT